MRTKQTPTAKIEAPRRGRPTAIVPTTMITLRIRTDHLEEMRAEAERRRLPLSTWLKQSAFDALDRAAAKAPAGGRSQ